MFIVRTLPWEILRPQNSQVQQVNEHLFELLVMVALWNRADHYIFILSFVLFSSLIFFLSSPNLSRAQLCRAIIFAIKPARIDIGKKLLSSNMSSTCPHNMVNVGPLAAEIDPVVWPLQISTGFASWQRYCSASSGRQPNFAALNRGRHLCSAGRRSRWALAHILVFYLSITFVSSTRSQLAQNVVHLHARMLSVAFSSR